jgi:hypothetical protein
MKKVNEFFIYAVMLDSLIVGVARLPQSYPNVPYQELRMWVCYVFVALEINKYIV